MKDFKVKREEHNLKGGVPDEVFDRAISEAGEISNTIIKEWIIKALDASKITGKLSEEVIHQRVKDFETNLPPRNQCAPDILEFIMKLYKLCVWETLQHGPTTENNYEVDGRLLHK
eukprot:CAMPEP_0114415196 /NCGR_PEP_ID=MMETSP0103-20121206/1785_1 /TAXON_ID=37642 ORGANISM="Paraphysomonas imperforata, Strain PA2" /NCGR_SAMPLE_ID=MMETSP0103 /ASSEMBLY_ACC=CAM_ASM_000201 /LENGTH=115 /DNA_ID=CAMNT_0001583373 /DNA_START=143 /DNA_END=490 /DNA_ORIENTATION=-